MTAMERECEQIAKKDSTALIKLKELIRSLAELSRGFAAEVQEEWMVLCHSLLDISNQIATLYQLKLQNIEQGVTVSAPDNKLISFQKDIELLRK